MINNQSRNTLVIAPITIDIKAYTGDLSFLTTAFKLLDSIKNIIAITQVYRYVLTCKANCLLEPNKKIKLSPLIKTNPKIII